MSAVGEHGAARIFDGPGEMRALCRAMDWGATPLGPVEGWPLSLRTIVAAMLGSRHPMFLFWGPDLVQVYNDAYRPSLGEGGRHPRALGMRGREFWTDIWETIGPQIEQVMSGGGATWHEDQYLPILRNGRLEDVWWTYSYSPVVGDDGEIAATLVVCQETTTRVLAERRMLALNRELELERERLAFVFRQAPSFLAVLRGPEHVFELANEAYHQLVGRRELIGRRLLDALPEVGTQGFAALLDRVLATGEPYVGREVPVMLVRTPGGAPEERFVDFVYQPLIDGDGSRSGIAAHGSDVTEHVRARRALERVAERSGQLQALTSALAAATTPDEVSEVVAEQGLRAAGAATALLAARMPGDEHATILRHEGPGSLALVGYRPGEPLRPTGPGSECIRTGRPIFEETRAAIAARFPAVSYVWEALGTQALATVPLVVADETIGTISFTFTTPRTFAREDREFFLALARQAAQALERARLFAAEREARAEADAARHRVAFLADASARLAASLDFEATLRTVADLAVPALTDWCFVELRDPDGSIRPAAVAHQDPARVALGWETMRRWPIDPAAPFGTGKVMRTGEPELASDIPPEAFAAVARDEEHLRVLREVAFVSSLSVPIPGPDGRPMGVLTFASSESGRRFGPADLALASEVAQRAGVALASARLYAAEESALRRATALQRVTSALAGALTPAQVADAVMAQGVSAMDAQAGTVLRVDDSGSQLEILRFVGYPEPAMDQWRHLPLSRRLPITEAIRTREPVFLESVEEWRARFEDFGPLRVLPDSRAWAALPLGVEGRVLGGMGLSFAYPRTFTAEDRAFMLALAQQCGQALERARLFDAERAARAEAERANRAKSEFLAVMSHELRTPLNAIGGYAEILSMGIRGPVSERQREDLDRIQRSQKHLLGLINEVLNYARLETGTVRYDVAEVRVAAAVAAVESLILPQVHQKALTLGTSSCDPSVTMRADAEKVRQILVNLLSNAVKFTEPGGRIDIECRRLDGDRVALVVRDTGAGIPEDKLEAIFEPFVQVGRALNSPGEGTGLGLSISRDLARGMGGDLTVESEMGVGSVFALVLPAGGVN